MGFTVFRTTSYGARNFKIIENIVTVRPTSKSRSRPGVIFFLILLQTLFAYVLPESDAKRLIVRNSWKCDRNKKEKLRNSYVREHTAYGAIIVSRRRLLAE